MTLDQERVQELFNVAMNMASAEREPFLDKECGENDSLRGDVESLLEHHFTSAQTVLPNDQSNDTTLDYQRGDMIGSFKILNVLGEGGMGIVYLAEQSKPVKRRVALKVIKAGMDTKQVVARFEAERQALAIMNHPGIAQVYEAGVTEHGRPYFVMEHVKGMPITDACDELKLTMKQRLELMAKVCDAVQHAHSKMIIHRDLKPNNILVSLDDKKLEPKIIDFGVAKAMTYQLTEKTLVTQVGHFVGTPAYMSPEQADLKAIDIDAKTDVYALGVVLYEVLTGMPPFDPQTLRDAGLEKMREIIRTQPPPKPSTQLSSITDATDATKIAQARQTQIAALAGLLRKELEWIPLKALKKQRNERYDSAKSMGDDIRRYLAGEALEAGPETIKYRLKKHILRNKTAFTTSVVIFIVFVLGISSTTWQWARAEERTKFAAGETLLREELEATTELLKERSSAAIIGRIKASISLGVIASTIRSQNKSSDDQLEPLSKLLGYKGGEESAVVIPITGVITSASMQTKKGINAELLDYLFEEISNKYPAISLILLKIDSGGGVGQACEEIIEVVHKYQNVFKIVALIQNAAGSAAGIALSLDGALILEDGKIQFMPAYVKTPDNYLEWPAVEPLVRKFDSFSTLPLAFWKGVFLGNTNLLFNEKTRRWSNDDISGDEWVSIGYTYNPDIPTMKLRVFDANLSVRYGLADAVVSTDKDAANYFIPHGKLYDGYGEMLVAKSSFAWTGLGRLDLIHKRIVDSLQKISSKDSSGIATFAQNPWNDNRISFAGSYKFDLDDQVFYEKSKNNVFVSHKLETVEERNNLNKLLRDLQYIYYRSVGMKSQGGFIYLPELKCIYKSLKSFLVECLVENPDADNKRYKWVLNEEISIDAVSKFAEQAFTNIHNCLSMDETATNSKKN